MNKTIESSPSQVICLECKAEILDPFSRRYRYPFTWCRKCEPNNRKRHYKMCKDCQREYENTSDRHFGVQSLGCYICGPVAWLERSDGKPIVSDMFSMLDDVDAVTTLLQRGEIVAIKGLTGFYLTCDAKNDLTYEKLLNNQDSKPFALIAKDLEIIKEYNNHFNNLGFMLPPTGLEHLYLRRMNSPIVVTNSLAITDEEAKQKFSHIANYFLFHN